MRIKILSFMLLLTSISKAQQEKEFHFLSETGIEQTANESCFHFGIGIEYSLNNSSSFLVRVKYHNAGINKEHKSSSNSGIINFNLNPSYKIIFKSKLITIPFNYKYEKVFFSKKFSIFSLIGPALNFTIDEEYTVAENIKLQNNKTYINFNLGLGFGYHINPKSSIFINTEILDFGGGKTDKKGFPFSSSHFPNSMLLNIGYKFKI